MGTTNDFLLGLKTSYSVDSRNSSVVGFMEKTGVEVDCFNIGGIEPFETMEEGEASKEILKRVARDVIYSSKSKGISPIDFLDTMVGKFDKIHHEVCLNMLAESIADKIPLVGQRFKEVAKKINGPLATLVCVAGGVFDNPELEGFKGTKFGGALFEGEKTGLDPLDEFFQGLHNPRETWQKALDSGPPLGSDYLDLVEFFYNFGIKAGRSLERLFEILSDAIGRVFGENIGRKANQNFKEEFDLFSKSLRDLPEKSVEVALGLVAVAQVVPQGLPSVACQFMAVVTVFSPFVKDVVKYSLKQVEQGQKGRGSEQMGLELNNEMYLA